MPTNAEADTLQNTCIIRRRQTPLLDELLQKFVAHHFKDLFKQRKYIRLTGLIMLEMQAKYPENIILHKIYKLRFSLHSYCSA